MVDLTSGPMRVGGGVDLHKEARDAFLEIEARDARAAKPRVEYGFQRVGVTWLTLPAGGPVPAEAVVVLNEIERRARKMDAALAGRLFAGPVSR